MIRLAREEDFPEIMKLARLFWAELDYPEPFEEGTALQYLHMAHDQMLVLVLEVEGRIEGLAAALKFPLIGAGSTNVVTELMYYVHAPYRGRGLRLLRALEKAARRVGAKYLNMISIQCVAPEVSEAVYKRMGYTHTETNWRKEL